MQHGGPEHGDAQHGGPEHSEAEHGGPEHGDAQHGGPEHDDSQHADSEHEHTKVFSHPLSTVMFYATPWFEMLCGREARERVLC